MRLCCRWEGDVASWARAAGEKTGGAPSYWLGAGGRLLGGTAAGDAPKSFPATCGNWRCSVAGSRPGALLDLARCPATWTRTKRRGGKAGEVILLQITSSEVLLNSSSSSSTSFSCCGSSHKLAELGEQGREEHTHGNHIRLRARVGWSISGWDARAWVLGGGGALGAEVAVSFPAFSPGQDSFLNVL
jgi:hypothetical protein